MQAKMKGIHKQLVRFGLVGLLNTLIGITAIYGLMFFFNTNLMLANGIGYAIGLVVSFMLNKTWTFSDRQGLKQVFPLYLVIAAVAYGINLAVVVTTHEILEFDPYLAQITGIGFYTIMMFVGSRWLVFRRAVK